MKKYKFYCHSDEDEIEFTDDVTEEELEEYYREFIAGVDKGFYELKEEQEC